MSAWKEPESKEVKEKRRVEEQKQQMLIAKLATSLPWIVVIVTTFAAIIFIFQAYLNRLS